jgi:hypothetical protein
MSKCNWLHFPSQLGILSLLKLNASLLIRQCLFKTQAYFLGLIITFVNTFHFNFSFNVCVFCKSIFICKLDLFTVNHFIIQGKRFWDLQVRFLTFESLRHKDDRGYSFINIVCSKLIYILYSWYNFVFAAVLYN